MQKAQNIKNFLFYFQHGHETTSTQNNYTSTTNQTPSIRDTTSKRIMDQNLADTKELDYTSRITGVYSSLKSYQNLRWHS